MYPECEEYYEGLERSIVKIREATSRMARGEYLDLKVEELYLNSFADIKFYIQKINDNCSQNLRHKNYHEDYESIITFMENEKINGKNVKKYLDKWYIPLENHIDKQSSINIPESQIKEVEDDSKKPVRKYHKFKITIIIAIIGIFLAGIQVIDIEKQYFPDSSYYAGLISLLLGLEVVFLFFYLICVVFFQTN